MVTAARQHLLSSSSSSPASTL
jgi:hypothetical protein